MRLIRRWYNILTSHQGLLIQFARARFGAGKQAISPVLLQLLVGALPSGRRPRRQFDRAARAVQDLQSPRTLLAPRLSSRLVSSRQRVRLAIPRSEIALLQMR